MKAVKNLFQFKAIETRFDGCLFRSRLEARGAVFFKTLGIEYRYELEGFELHGIRYLPDFYLPQLDCWVEIKPTTPSPEEREKAIRLCMHTKQYVYIFAGDVWSDVKVYAFSFIGYTPQDIHEIFDVGSAPFPSLLTPLYWLSTVEFVGQDAYGRFIGGDLPRHIMWGESTWVECPACQRVYIDGMWIFQSCHKEAYHHPSPRLNAAYTAARSARFEHGENGA